MYPIFLELTDLPVIVIGGGATGERKVCALLAEGARVRLVSPQLSERLQTFADQGSIEVEQRGYQDGDLAGMHLAFAATDHEPTNRAIANEANRRGVWVNVVNAPTLGNFHVPCQLRRGELRVAVSTSGHSPAFARLLRGELEALLPESDGRFVALMGELRDELGADPELDHVHRKLIYERVLRSNARRLLAEGDEGGARSEMRRCISGP